jgi:hypothetical protein
MPGSPPPAAQACPHCPDTRPMKQNIGELKESGEAIGMRVRFFLLFWTNLNRKQDVLVDL